MSGHFYKASLIHVNEIGIQKRQREQKSQKFLALLPFLHFLSFLYSTLPYVLKPDFEIVS